MADLHTLPHVSKDTSPKEKSSTSVTKLTCTHSGYIPSPVNDSNQQLVAYLIQPTKSCRPSFAQENRPSHTTNLQQSCVPTAAEEAYEFCHDQLGSAVLTQHRVISCE